MRIVFIGPPGAGKGTQCRRLSDDLGIPHISSGEMLRASKGETKIGRLIASFIDYGNLVPDEVVMQFIIDRVAQPDCRDGYLFDGFPRTVSQAVSFDQYLKSHAAVSHTAVDGQDEQGESISAVIQLVAEEDELVSRLLTRAKIENRVDDTLETITARLQVFRDRTEPVLEYYGRQNLVRRVDAMRSPDEVYAVIRSIVASL